MHPFLPDLVCAGRFVSGAKMLQLMEEPIAPFRPQLGQKRARGKLFQVADGLRQVGAGDDGVEVVVENNPGVNAQILVLAAKFRS